MGKLFFDIGTAVYYRHTKILTASRHYSKFSLIVNTPPQIYEFELEIDVKVKEVISFGP